MIQAAPGAAPQAGEAIRGLRWGEPRSRSGQQEIWEVAEDGSTSRRAANHASSTRSPIFAARMTATAFCAAYLGI